MGNIESSQYKISVTEESIGEVTEDENISDANTTDSNAVPGFGTALSTFALLMIMFLRRKD